MVKDVGVNNFGNLDVCINYWLDSFFIDDGFCKVVDLIVCGMVDGQCMKCGISSRV